MGVPPILIVMSSTVADIARSKNPFALIAAQEGIENLVELNGGVSRSASEWMHANGFAD